MRMSELSAQEKAQYQDVASELRCLVCQNQSIYDSQAGLATDLKQIIVDQIRAGKNKQEIKTYMEDRYGEFILYQPELSASPAGLWAGPFVVLLLAIILARRVIKSRSKAASGGSAKAEKADTNWAESLYQKEKK
ncbi:MAG: cytochrome c-type biogenesis protein [Limnobacter sp.]|nr:cytochrome c-type biogenesis protein [Limnobacter sp.]